MISATLPFPEGSRKTPKGAKGAAFFLCALLHSSCSLRAIIKNNYCGLAPNRLTVCYGSNYADSVANKDATGFDSPIYSGRTTANGGIILSVPCCTSYGAAVVGRLRPAGFLEYRSVNPVICRSSPFDSGVSGPKPLLKEAHMPGTNSSVHSPSEQPKQPVPPFRYWGGDLGLNSNNGHEPFVYFVDQTGQKWLTHSLEFLLSSIDSFTEGRDREQMLAAAALHYGFDDLWILIKGRAA